MIADRNRIYDGFASLEGGVDSGREPHLIDPNQCSAAENFVFRGGRAKTRPGFRILDESFVNAEHGYYNNGNPVPEGEDVPLVNQAKNVYRKGVFQTAIGFNTHQGDDCIMTLIGGRLFKIVPLITTAKVTEIGLPQRNSKHSPIAYMVQADKWLIAQDGESQPIIYNGNVARRAIKTSDVDRSEVPVGTLLASGMGRIVTVVHERDIAFGDLYGSHDLPDPADSLPLFTERNFLAEGFDASIPFQQGSATGMAFFPQLDTSTGNGQLLVFAERGATSFFLSLPREEWKTSQFQILALLTTGLRGHRSIAVVNEDLWFRSDDGVRSYRQARSEPSGWAHIPLSTNVKQFLDVETGQLLRYASAIYFDNRIVMTCSPHPNVSLEHPRGRPFHTGLVVVDFDILSSFGTRFKPAWDGHWTMGLAKKSNLPQVRVTQLVTGTFNGVTRAFAFCLDEEDNNQLYEFTTNEKSDWNGCIEWEIETRAFDFKQQGTQFEEQKLYDGDIWLREIVECQTQPRAEQAGGPGPEPEPPPEPPPIVPTGACCIDFVCSIKTQEECESLGGTYMGDGVPCDPNPCGSPADPTGACCKDGVCSMKTESECAASGGTWLGADVTCDSTPSLPLPPPGAFTHYHQLTIDHTKVPSDQADFPVLVSITDPTLKTVANGGHVANSNGYDIRPYSISPCPLSLDFELERYDGATGEVVMWVKMPAVSSSTDTVFYLYYGDPAMSTNASSTAVWSNGFVGVYHLKDGTTLDVTNSTGGNNGINHSATAAPGQIDGGASFVSASLQYITVIGDYWLHPSITISAWAKATSFPHALNVVAGHNGTRHLIYVKSNGKLKCRVLVNLTPPDNVVQYDGTGSHTLSTGAWYHLAMTYDPASGLVGYVNGAIDGTAPSLGGPVIGDFESFVIGTDTLSGPTNWDGLIDEARLSLPRSADWITTEFNNQGSPGTFMLMGPEVPLP